MARTSRGVYSEVAHRKRFFDCRALAERDAHRARFQPRRDYFLEPRSDEMRRGTVVERESRRESALDQSQQYRPPFFFAVVMRTARAAHESEPVIQAAS